MLVEIAIGDAYGAAFEYVKPSITQIHNDLAKYYKHPRHGIEPGCYTDDTQMSLALAEALLSEDSWNPIAITEKFVNAFKRDPREGYASGFYDFLCHVSDAEDFLDRIRPDSEKSGAAMRSCPLGILEDVNEIKERATIQAKITHDTRGGIESSIAVALMTHYFQYDIGPKAELGDFLLEHVSAPWNEKWNKKVGALGMMSVRAAVSALRQYNTLSDLLKACVHYTGDVDTVAAIALGAGSCSREIKNDLPLCLYEELENGDFGRNYLKEVDEQLMNKYFQKV